MIKEAQCIAYIALNGLRRRSLLIILCAANNINNIYIHSPLPIYVS